MHHTDFSRLVEGRIGTYVDVEAQKQEEYMIHGIGLAAHPLPVSGPYRGECLYTLLQTVSWYDTVN